MGFLLKKMIASFLMPLPLGMILLSIALFFLLKEQHKKGKLFLMSGLLWLFAFSYDPLANLLLYQIESRYPTLHQAPAQTRYIYVLGASHHSDAKLPITAQVNPEAVVRLTEGIRLYHQLKGKATLILSGYSGFSDPLPHALMQKQLAMSLGIPASSIIIEPSPKDTQEEAQVAKKRIQDQTLILVTSASHMPRAMRWFQKEGLHPIPAPTAHHASIAHLHYFAFFSVKALEISTIAFYELLGTVWQALKGG